ncbi:MAG: hypothetical protein ACFFCZ_03255 [Promethearchaeota archaeon]
MLISLVTGFIPVYYFMPTLYITVVEDIIFFGLPISWRVYRSPNNEEVILLAAFVLNSIFWILFSFLVFIILIILFLRHMQKKRSSFLSIFNNRIENFLLRFLDFETLVVSLKLACIALGVVVGVISCGLLASLTTNPLIYNLYSSSLPVSVILAEIAMQPEFPFSSIIWSLISFLVLIAGVIFAEILEEPHRTSLILRQQLLPILIIVLLGGGTLYLSQYSLAAIPFMPHIDRMSIFSTTWSDTSYSLFPFPWKAEAGATVIVPMTPIEHLFFLLLKTRLLFGITIALWMVMIYNSILLIKKRRKVTLQDTPPDKGRAKTPKNLFSKA